MDEKGLSSGNLIQVLCAGIGRLVREGYTFKGITADAEGNYEKVQMQDDAPHSALADVVAGTFSYREYALDALAWCSENAPKVDMAWLAAALEGNEVA